MSEPALTDFKVIIFDCYGTLADWETGIFNALQPLLARFPSSAQWSRKEALLAFTEIEKDLQRKDPGMLYCDLLSNAHAVLAEGLRDNDVPAASLKSLDNHTDFGQSIKDWPIFPDTCDALRDLQKHYKLVILSNVDHNSFASTHAKLSQDTSHPSLYARPLLDANAQWLPQNTPDSRSPFSLILTAQDTGAYKPDPRGMLFALDIIQKQFGIGKEQVLVVAQSLYHDVEPSSKLDVHSVWINRQGACMGLETLGESPKWLKSFETLGEMAEAVKAEKPEA
ncbi:HAD-like domain-containing protein [Favolaschia claudopus]|uniref:HAD-like domain-containing protein n=1 Tax=Favolaschia claudopus TaxID=2862362 RepID=A0AAW0DKW8_9AGAR